MSSRHSWRIPMFVVVACLLPAAMVTAQVQPVVLIDATVLPTPHDTVSDEALRQKFNAADEGGDVEVSELQAVVSQNASGLVLPGTPDKAIPACVGIDVRSTLGQLFSDSFESGNTDAWGQSNVVFSADRVLDLIFDVYFDGTLIGDHVLHLKLTTPRGHLYQTLTTPISSQTTAVGGQRRLAGYPYPVDVEVLEPVSASVSSASLRLPVAGTSIVTHGLFGTWTMEAFVDQEVERCGDSVTFRLVP